jgi:N-acetylglucosaminyldiphosphoundecaprenol N-acetyl-beta-D-mannosaminyltransferase
LFSTPTINLIGTPLLATSYEALRRDLLAAARVRIGLSIDFTNTHIVTARRHDPRFRIMTDFFDAFVPDGMPLIWCLNAKGAGLNDRVYGPTFTRRFLATSPAEARHYFLGGSSECLERLVHNMRALNPSLNVVGRHHGYFGPEEQDAILRDILAAKTEFLWVGLGTPKQQEWIKHHRTSLPGIVILAVGFAFDVNAGTKPDAPDWMQRFGLTWLFRLFAEPRRLLRRYALFNSLFLFYLVRDSLILRRETFKGRRSE